MSTDSVVEYTPEEVRLALQLAGRPIEPLILRREATAEEMARGIPEEDWVCAGCGARRSRGRVALSRAEGVLHCPSCRRACEARRIPPGLLASAVRALGNRRRDRLAAARREAADA